MSTLVVVITISNIITITIIMDCKVFTSDTPFVINSVNVHKQIKTVMDVFLL